MKPLRIAVLLITAVVSAAQVSTQYLDFGQLGLAVLTAQYSSGNLYVVGVLENYAGIRVYKVSPSGAILYRFTFGSAVPTAAVVDRSGALYIAGAADAAAFPTVHPLLSYVPSGGAGFICKIDPAGSQLVFSTLLGGRALAPFLNVPTGAGVGGIALDPAGNVYVACWTTAPDFPITAGAFQSTGPTVGPGPPGSGGLPILVRSAFV